MEETSGRAKEEGSLFHDGQMYRPQKQIDNMENRDDKILSRL